MKICCVCKVEKPLDAYRIRKIAPSGREAQCRACRCAYDARRYARNPRRKKDEQMRHNYGVSLERFEIMVAEQDGRCWLCGEPEMHGKALAMDHHHGTDTPRRPLCGRCNRTMERVDTVPNWLERAAEYKAKFG